MTGAVATLRDSGRSVQNLLPRRAWGVLVILLAIAYPLIIDQLFANSGDLLDASINTLGYIIMALA